MTLRLNLFSQTKIVLLDNCAIYRRRDMKAAKLPNWDRVGLGGEGRFG
jgi:hypothetical protein